MAPRRDNKPRGNRLDKREQEELLKRSKAGEEVEKPYAQGERVQGLGFAPVTKAEAPDPKLLLQRQIVPEEEGPSAPAVSYPHRQEEDKVEQEPLSNAVKEDSQQLSDEIKMKRRRKEEKRAAKEQRREEKRAAKKMRREKRRRHASTSSDEKVIDVEGSRTKSKRHVSDSSDEEHTLSRKDARVEGRENQRNRRGPTRVSGDDASPRGVKRTHDGLRSDESDEGVQERPSGTKDIPGRKGENSRVSLVRDTRDVYDGYKAEKGRRPSVAIDRGVEENIRSKRENEGTRDGEYVKGWMSTSYHSERDRKYGRGYNNSPRQRYNYDDREERGESPKIDKYSEAHTRAPGSPRLGRNPHSDDDTKRRQAGGNETRRHQPRDETSRRGDGHYSRGNGRYRRRSPS